MQGSFARWGFSSSIQYLPSPRCFSTFHLHQKCLIHNQKLFEKLNIPPKPKKPPSPFLMFVEQVRPTILKEFPGLKMTEIAKLAAQRWSVVDSKLKAKLNEQFAEETITYNKLKNQYEQNLTAEQKNLLQEARNNDSELKKERKLRKKLKELGKPKQPAGIFIRYLLSKSSEKDKYPTVNDWVKAASEEWKTVGADIKAKLEDDRKMDREKYNKELKLWEKRMVQEGNVELVRKESLLPPAKIKLKK